MPGMPGYYYVLNYDSNGVYHGTYIAGSTPVTPVQTTPVTTAQGSDYYDIAGDVGVPLHKQVPYSSSWVAPTMGGAAKVYPGDSYPPGISETAYGATKTVLYSGTPTSGGVYTLHSYGNVITFSINGPVSTVTTPVETTPVTTTPTGPVAVGTVGTGTKGWLAARADARSGKTICRSNWKDRYIYFSRYLYWIQFYDPTTKLLGTVRVVQASDFGVSEFQAQDWTIFGDYVTPALPSWNYPLATTL